jgi:hypothetical protein
MKHFLILLLSISVFLTCQISFAQKVYRNEMGGIITKEQYEDKILNGPYFGVPGNDPNEQVLIHRMPFGKVDNPEIFYKALELEEVLKVGKPIVVIFYPGKDECNSTGLVATNKKLRRKNHEWLVKNIESKDGYGPVYLYKNPSGLNKYQGIMTHIPDPGRLFEQTFFKFPYPCGSFVVMDPSGNYHSILGEYPNSQIIEALKKLEKAK